MINIEFESFDWDDGNIEKCQKHGVSLETIEWFLKQPTILIAPDLKHSEKEARYLAVGKEQDNKPLFVVFTFRIIDDLTYIRPVSARYMHKKEIDRYEQESS